jgi:hypothetical protein
VFLLGFDKNRSSATWALDEPPATPNDPYKPPIYTSDCFAYFDFTMPNDQSRITVEISNGKLSAKATVKINVPCWVG